MTNVNNITNTDKLTANQNSLIKSKSSSNNFSSFLGETKSLDEIFNNAADKYDVPVNLLKSIGKAESEFRETVVSRSGAVGIMQLMPATAAYLGVKDSYDAEQNIMGGAKYIKELLGKYNGDTSLALAAYNAGSGNVAKYGGIPPFQETQNYVKKVLNYMKTDIQTGVMTTSNTTTPSSVYTNINYTTLKNVSLIGTNTSLLTSTNEESTEVLNNLDDLFSYDKYLEFLELFMKNMSKEDSEKEKKEEQNNSTLNALNYNVPILNLLNQTKL